MPYSSIQKLGFKLNQEHQTNAMGKLYSKVRRLSEGHREVQEEASRGDRRELPSDDDNVVVFDDSDIREHDGGRRGRRDVLTLVRQ